MNNLLIHEICFVFFFLQCTKEKQQAIEVMLNEMPCPTQPAKLQKKQWEGVFWTKWHRILSANSTKTHSSSVTF